MVGKLTFSRKWLISKKWVQLTTEGGVGLKKEGESTEENMKGD